MTTIKTLLACWDEATDRARAILGRDFNVSVAHTLDEATRSLQREPFDLIVATIRFDESRPLELIPLAAGFGVPVALVRFGVSHLPPDLVAAAFMAARALGCQATLDLKARSQALGEEVAVAELRMALRAAANHIPEPSRFKGQKSLQSYMTDVMLPNTQTARLGMRGR